MVASTATPTAQVTGSPVVKLTDVRPNPRYAHFVVGGQVVSQSVDEIEYDVNGQIICPAVMS